MVCNAQSILKILHSCPSPIHDRQDAAISEGVLNGSIKIRAIGRDGSAALMAYEIVGDEFVVIALKSIKTSVKVDLCVEALDDAIKIAKEKGCNMIRFHTFRAGLVAKSLELGFLPVEFVMRKKI